MASYILDKAHEVVGDVVRPGDLAIDATVGNGWDTVFLAKLVGPTGFVLGFDIQSEAIERAVDRLRQAELLPRCKLVESPHEHMAEVLENESSGSAPTAVMFNLGYLPGADRTIATEPSTTIWALDAAVDTLAPGGVLTVVVYQGHAGAREERDAVLAWWRRLDPARFSCERVEDPDGPPHAPFLIVVRK